MVGSFVIGGITTVLGFLYPAYECYKCMERKRPDGEQLRFWCQYWIVVALITVLEKVGYALIPWIPMYPEAKLAFCLYLWHPKTRGTTYIYSTFVRPFVAEHEQEIDENLNEFKIRAGQFVFSYWQTISAYLQYRFLELLQYLAAQAPKPPNAPPGVLAPDIRVTQQFRDSSQTYRA